MLLRPNTVLCPMTREGATFSQINLLGPLKFLTQNPLGFHENGTERFVSLDRHDCPVTEKLQELIAK